MDHKPEYVLTEEDKQFLRANKGHGFKCPYCKVQTMRLFTTKSQKDELYCEDCHRSIALFDRYGR